MSHVSSAPPEKLSADEIRELREELAKAKIREVIYRYCRGVDRADEALTASAFHEKAYEEHGPAAGSARKFATHSATVVPAKLLTVQHMIGNILIELDGDMAKVETYLISTQRRHAKPGVIGIFAGRYLDRFECHNGEWRIARRTVVNDWTWRTEMPPDSITEDTFPRGRADKTDAVFLDETWVAKWSD